MFSRRKNDNSTPKEAVFEDQPGFTYGYGYFETDPYIFMPGGGVISFFDILINYGTHNPEDAGWVTQIIPREKVPHCKLQFFEREKGVPKSEEDTIVSKNLLVQSSH